jgi:hypothetical protein
MKSNPHQMEMENDIICHEKDCIHHGVWLECCICCRWNRAISLQTVIGDYKNVIKESGY